MHCSRSTIRKSAELKNVHVVRAFFFTCISHHVCGCAGLIWDVTSYMDREKHLGLMAVIRLLFLHMSPRTRSASLAYSIIAGRVYLILLGLVPLRISFFHHESRQCRKGQFSYSNPRTASSCGIANHYFPTCSSSSATTPHRRLSLNKVPEISQIFSMTYPLLSTGRWINFVADRGSELPL